MDLKRFIGQRVKVETNNQDFYYAGLVINADEDFLELRDIHGCLVQLNKSVILIIKEQIK